MSTTAEPVLLARNPATGEVLGQVTATPAAEVAESVERCARAQGQWGESTARERRAWLRLWRQRLSRDAGMWEDLLCREVGKPRPEALGEIISTLDQLRWLERNAERELAPERLRRSWQRMMLIPPARLRWIPRGVVGIVGTWNYPLFLTVPAIAAAVAAGNGVIWKPSELASLTGRAIQESLRETGLPADLVATVYGGPEVGRALIDAPIQLGHFTGGIAAGRAVLETLAARGIPAVAELSGYDAAIVLGDAPEAATLDGLTWASFVNAGQTCIAVKRVYIVDDSPRRPWAQRLAERARRLRLGDPSGQEVDVGPMISRAARDRFAATIQRAIAAGAGVLAGGEPAAGDGWFYPPTVLEAEPGNEAPEEVLSGCFGPVMLVRRMTDAAAAIEAANRSAYGLAGSVWTANRRVGRALAVRLKAGMVGVNDAVAPSAHAAAPFGGVGASGHGRVHGAVGLREFAQTQVLHDRAARGPRPQVYPYSGMAGRALGFYRRLFHW